MKYAVIIMFELRAIKKTIDKIYKYIIDYYNADVFIICQKQFDDDNERVKLFNRNVKFVKLYDKPDINEYFGINSNLNMAPIDGNWKIPSTCQIYINYNEASKIIKDYFNDYDYFITVRVDSDILTEFPPNDLIEKIPHAVYGFSPKYCWWGGLGTALLIHKQYIMDYLTSYYDILTNNKFIENIINTNEDFNQEKLLNLALKIKNINIEKIMNINLYYTAETLNDYTTWAKIYMHPLYNVVCKYPEQCEEAFDTLDKWNNGKRWTYEDNCIFLK